MKNEKNLFTKNDFEVLYDRMNDDRGLMEQLVNMQRGKGITERKAYENADQLIRLVAQRENLCFMLSEDSQAVLDEFFGSLSGLDAEARMMQLRALSFGLQMYQDEALQEKLKEGENITDLFKAYCSTAPENDAVTQEQLEAEIRSRMGGYRISPQAMRTIAKAMAEGQSMLTTGATLGKDGMKFKCLVSMDLYLRNSKEMSLEEAAVNACHKLEIQAAADAVACGQITEQQAKEFLEMVFSVTSILWFVLALTIPQLGLAAAVTAKLVSLKNILLSVSFVGNLITEPVAEMMGKLAAKHRFVRRCEESQAAQAMENMADHMERQKKVAAAVEEAVQTETETVREAVRMPAFG